MSNRDQLIRAGAPCVCPAACSLVFSGELGTIAARSFALGAEAVANGEAELGVTQMSEILHETSAELVGPLPPEIQHYTNFSSAVGAGAKQVDAAKALRNYLASPDAARVMKASGVEPPG